MNKNKENTGSKQQQPQNIPNNHRKNVIRIYIKFVFHQILSCMTKKENVERGR